MQRCSANILCKYTVQTCCASILCTHTDCRCTDCKSEHTACLQQQNAELSLVSIFQLHASHPLHACIHVSSSIKAEALTFQSEAQTPGCEGLSQHLEARLVRQEGCQGNSRQVQVCRVLCNIRLSLAHCQQLCHLPHVGAPGVAAGVQKCFLLGGQNLRKHSRVRGVC